MCMKHQQNSHFQRTDARNSCRSSQVKEGKIVESALGWSAHFLTLCSSTSVSIHAQEMAPVRQNMARGDKARSALPFLGMIGSSEEGFGSQANQSHHSNSKSEILIDCEMRKDLPRYRLRKCCYRADASPIYISNNCRFILPVC
jgi:hypothetical protein